MPHAAKRHHPDVNEGSATAAEQFKRLTGAYTRALAESVRRERARHDVKRGKLDSARRAAAGASATRSARPVDPRQYNVREWEHAHYGMHRTAAATGWGSQASRQSEYARHLHRQGLRAKRASADAGTASAAARRGPLPVRPFGWLIASVAVITGVWGLVFETNVGRWSRR